MPEHITISEHDLRLNIGNTFTLTTTLLPANASNPNVIWSTDDASIATVDNGVVTAINKGTTTIYAIAEENMRVADSCSVEVYAYMSDAEARRIWAYDLNLSKLGSAYLFEFKAITNANQANILFLDTNNKEIGRYALDNVQQGYNEYILQSNEIVSNQGQVRWALELHADPILKMVEITADAADKYYYYLPQDVAINNNPYSEYFGKIYVAEPYHGAADGKSTHSKTQTKGIYVYDPLLNLENYANGYIPSNVTLNDADRYMQLHRIAINPITDEIAFAQSAGAHIWSIDASALAEETSATNLLANINNILQSQSLCFDASGTLYVLDNKEGTLYRINDGIANIVAQSTHWANDRNSIVSDGRGGIWMTQYRAQLDDYDMLSHINAEGNIDFSANKLSNDKIKALLPSNTARGQIAYYAKDQILALGGDGKVILYKVTYSQEGIPSLEKWLTTPILGTNIDGLAFDYAGDLVVMSASAERFYKFALPTENNVITIPAQMYIINNTPTFSTSVSAGDINTKKIMRNGIIYILRNGEIYTLQGTKLK